MLNEITIIYIANINHSNVTNVVLTLQIHRNKTHVIILKHCI
jgi:hypothetical protein